MPFPLKTSVRIKPSEAEHVEKIAAQGTDQAQALSALTGIVLGTAPSAATTLHAVVAAGLKAIEDRAQEIGYRRLAEFTDTDEESRRWRESRRARAARRLAVQEGAA